MNPKAEASTRLGGRYDARVLEPSPPAVTEAPWFADDPVGRGEAAGEVPRVTPVPGSDHQWADLIADDPELAGWASDRWLGAYRRLEATPSAMELTRLSLHRLAEHVMSPARAHANGKIALRYTRGGFGTPFFADDVQVRVVGDQLIVQTGGSERPARVTSLSAMAAHLGPELLPAADLDDRQLVVDPEASAFLGEWFGFAASVLEELRAGVPDGMEPSRVQLWPEHFDLAVELGVESNGQRAGYGASPGDELHADPYLYVVPWGEVPAGPLWEAEHYRGAELPYAELLDADDQRGTALRFFRTRIAALTEE